MVHIWHQWDLLVHWKATSFRCLPVSSALLSLGPISIKLCPTHKGMKPLLNCTWRNYYAKPENATIPEGNARALQRQESRFFFQLLQGEWIAIFTLFLKLHWQFFFRLEERTQPRQEQWICIFPARQNGKMVQLLKQHSFAWRLDRNRNSCHEYIKNQWKINGATLILTNDINLMH